MVCGTPKRVVAGCRCGQLRLACSWQGSGRSALDDHACRADWEAGVTGSRRQELRRLQRHVAGIRPPRGRPGGQRQRLLPSGHHVTVVILARIAIGATVIAEHRGLEHELLKPARYRWRVHRGNASPSGWSRNGNAFSSSTQPTTLCQPSYAVVRKKGVCLCTRPALLRACSSQRDPLIRTGHDGQAEHDSQEDQAMTASSPQPGQRAVVTGGAGFLGSPLSERLARQGIRVTCVDNFITGSTGRTAARGQLACPVYLQAMMAHAYHGCSSFTYC